MLVLIFSHLQFSQQFFSFNGRSIHLFCRTFFFPLMMVYSFTLQDVDIDSQYKNYRTTTRQSLEAWSGSELDLGLVCSPRNFRVHVVPSICWTD